MRVRVMTDTLPVEGAVVRSGRVGRATDAAGHATLALAAGPHAVTVSRIGFAPDTVALTLVAGRDTALVVQLEPRSTDLESVIVSATRAERRVEDTPIRVEVVDEEEVAEKVAMTPGDVSMLLNETGGLRVQTTSPSLGGAGVRVQGLRGRYTLLLADGLPLYGGQAGGPGLLQIPPVDLQRVEVIKGSASALYGSSALGGVVDFISRRPGEEPTRELLLNQTTRGGSDAVFFAAAPWGASSAGEPAALSSASSRAPSPWGATLLVGAHRQQQTDIDGDAWADLPGYDRAVVRPRLFYDDASGRSLFATLGVTAEDRDGGTMPGAATVGNLGTGGSAVPAFYVEGLRTRRFDAGLSGRALLNGRDLLSARASATEQRHTHRFGATRERDVHRTAFAEGALTAPRGRVTLVAGAALQTERYRNTDVPGFDFSFTVPAVFAQADLDAAPWLVFSSSARIDWHNAYGTMVSPRLSVLLRRSDEGSFAGWTARASGGGGTFAPTPFTEETEATGLSPVRPYAPLAVERAVGGSLDIGGPLETPLGRVEINGTLFGSRLARAVVARALDELTANGVRRLTLVNAPSPTRTWGAEAVLRWLREPFRATASYAYTRATEWNADGTVDARRAVALVPRHTAGLVASVEEEDAHRVGLELYFTGRQSLEDNPYRHESRAYVVVGLLAERVVATPLGRARLFLNAENLGDVRQTRVDPLLLPSLGPGGRRTTDVWSLLDGRTFNAGVRLSF